MIREEDILEEQEDQIANEEYRIWKKNTPYLYDLLITHGLEWPSLTVNWLPIKDTNEKNSFSVQKLIIGTNTTNQESNSLYIIKTRLPNEEIQTDVKDKLDAKEKTNNPYKIEIETTINHEGDVNRARYMPQENKYNIIASFTQSGEIHIFDYFKHPPKPVDTSVRPELKLKYHSQEGYGISWNTLREGHLISGGYDHKIAFWDVNKQPTSGYISPVSVFEDHHNNVEDVCWSRENPDIFASVGDDRNLIIHDTRLNIPVNIVEAHSQEINSVDFSALDPPLLITGSADKTAALWDLRKLSVKVHSFEHHVDEIVGVRFNPKIKSLFASYGADRKVNIWDCSKIGTNQSNVDNEDGPPELLFLHAGHTSKVSDFDWNPNSEIMCASVADDNIIHLWEMANTIYYNDEDDDNRMQLDV